MTDSEKSKRRGMVRLSLAIGILLLLAAVAAGYWLIFMHGVVSSDDARLDGDLVDFAPRIGGTLAHVYVQEGDTVRAGRELFDLDQESLKAALAGAQARKKTAEADLREAQSEYEKMLRGSRPEEIRVAEAGEKKAKTAMELALTEWQRARSLHSKNALSTSDLDRARSAYQTAQQAHEEAVNRLEMLQKGPRREDIASALARVKAREAELVRADAEVRQSQVNLSFTEVTAPFDGIVMRKWESAGAVLAAGKPVLTLFNPSTLHVSANIEEKDLGDIAIGDPVDISVDAYPGLKLKGQVEKIMPVANSEFSLIPSEGVSGTYIKVTQRIPIRIAVKNPPEGYLGPGLSEEVRIHVASDHRGRHA